MPDTSTQVAYEPLSETGRVQCPACTRDFEIEPYPWQDFGAVDVSALSADRQAEWNRGPMRGVRLTLATCRRLAARLGMDVERVGGVYDPVFIVRERA